MSRSTARAAAMQMIFERVSGGTGGEETLQMIYEELREQGYVSAETQNEPDEEERAYISAAFDGVLEHMDALDALIGKTAKGWTIDRMSLVDLTVLRLALWEILYNTQVPDNVAISEALLLTERYSDPDDKPFVNGILGTIAREKGAGRE